MADTQLFIYKIQAVRHEMVNHGRTADEDRIVGEHFDYLQGLTARGVVHLAGRTLSDDYGGFGIIIFSASSEEEARRIVRDDPAVANRIMRAELYQFRASLVGQMPAD